MERDGGGLSEHGQACSCKTMDLLYLLLLSVVLCSARVNTKIHFGELAFQSGLNVTFGPVFALIFSLDITTMTQTILILYDFRMYERVKDTSRT
jgi:hypothetical protein